MIADQARDELTQITAERTASLADVEARWRASIVAALAAGVGATEVARLAGISRERVYQIRDGRRGPRLSGGLWTVETDATYDQTLTATQLPANRWSRSGRLGLELAAGLQTAVDATVALRHAGHVAWLTPGPGKVSSSDSEYVDKHGLG